MPDSKGRFLGFIPRGTLWENLTKFFIIPMIVIVILFFVADMIVMPEITRHGDEFPLPDIRGMSLTDAVDTLKSHGVELQIVGEEPVPNMPEGRIVSQNPLAGSMVKTERRVKVVVSAGEQMVEVPEMVGFSQRQTELKLHEAGLEVGTFNWARSDSLPVNVLVYSVPSGGSLVPEGTVVNLFFNRGSQSDVVFVPQFVGLNLGEAEYIADSLGLIIGRVDHAVSDELLPNTIMWQSERAGSKVEIGKEINLRVSVTD